MKKAPKDVNAYIAAAPQNVQGKLEQLRAAISKSVPDANERISYGMPYYEYKGRLAYFALAKAHIGFYLPTPVIAEHQDELTAYETTKATIRLPLDKPLPIALIKKLIKARARKNEAKKKLKG